MAASSRSQAVILRLRADAGHIPLADGSVHLCATSPPYANLRRYDDPAQVREWADGTRHALGNEPDPGLYIAHLVECFREVRRVLRSDGVCAVVIGDSYGRGKRPAWRGDARRGTNRRKSWAVAYAEGPVSEEAEAQDGNLLLIPYRFALAMQADGWTLRSEITWAKALSFCPSYSGSTMPESVSGWAWARCRVKVREGGCGDGKAMRRDPARGDIAPSLHMNRPTEWADCPGCARCASNDGLVLRRGSWRATRGHEAIFVFAKSGRYYGDGIAVEERAVSNHGSGNGYQREGRESYADTDGARSSDEAWEPSPGATRNLRDVWAISPTAFVNDGDAQHYAAFPEAIVEPLVRAFTSDRGVCPACGSPWARIVERTRFPRTDYAGKNSDATHDSHRRLSAMARGAREAGMPHEAVVAPTRTIGWRQTCACPAGEPVPATVLDVFCGTGTTLRVALKHRRRAIGCDLSRVYLAEIADARTRGVQTEMML